MWLDIESPKTGLLFLIRTNFFCEKINTCLTNNLGLERQVVRPGRVQAGEGTGQAEDRAVTADLRLGALKAPGVSGRGGVSEK